MYEILLCENLKLRSAKMSRNKSKSRILQIILQCNGGPMFDLPIENNKHPNFEWRGQGRGVDSFVLRSYPIWVQCLNNLVADYLNRKSSHTFLRKLIALISLCWDVRPLMAFYLLCLTSSCLNRTIKIKDFVIFRALHFVSRLTCLDIMQCGASRTISYSLLCRNEPKQRTKWKG